ncbi:MAG: hypothetical protein HOP10_12475 [Chitinophagaceae bacterium]|nr:hypothetical protein [Chitinophagaceae bacterium]
MKRATPILFLLIAFNSYSQDEFASNAFYGDLRKIYADAQEGFIKYKGEKRKSEFEELSAEYKVKFLLPLADSGKIVVPKTGDPYVVYFFEPNKNRLKIDQRAMSLRDAIVTAYEKPLYLRSETVVVNDRPLTNNWLFTDPDETKTSAAVFRITIFYQDNAYSLSLEIRGKSQ